MAAHCLKSAPATTHCIFNTYKGKQTLVDIIFTWFIIILLAISIQVLQTYVTAFLLGGWGGAMSWARLKNEESLNN